MPRLVPKSPFVALLTSRRRLITRGTINSSIPGASAPIIIGGVIEGPPAIGLSTIAENLILLRYVEIRSQLRRLISVVKMWDSEFDSSLREFRITATGIELAATFESAEAILSGFPSINDRRTTIGG
jgi:KaiC/GvpD/RAD55 family RecA-like ATPase